MVGSPGTAEECRRPEHAGLRERKKIATRRALGVAAMRLAVERGLENVLVDDIADAAGVSARTFNNYFASKYEAICALGFDRAMRVGAALRERPADEPLWDAIVAAVMSEYGGADQALDEDWMAGVRLVTGTPALRGEYLKVQAMTQYSVAEAIALRLDPGRVGDGRSAGGHGALAARGPASRAWPAGPAQPAAARRRHARRAAAPASPAGGEH